ncbi:MAG TPA: N-acetylglucosamine-6-phosphate deacetylase [Candidatus Humimicrobiaceae bacterium]|nr:N-acetylglucosamine-6-phosphate deacetylase [Candidatus Humimicrobiaceae bacterium]
MINKNNKTIISNGTIITPFQLFEDKVISIEKGKIIDIEDKKNIFEPAETEVIDAGEGFIVPGFIDIHVHGGGGFDIMDGRYEAVEQVASAHSRFGTTAFLPTTMTMSKDKIIESLKSVKEAIVKGTGAAEILGVHLEGPYINSERKGAQKKEDIKNPSIEEFLEFNLASGNLIRLVTIAPEMPGAIELIHWLSEHKIIASVGHSNATYEQVQESIRAGLNHVTHTFNAMSGLNHHEPGAAGAALSSPELTVEMIADGVHLHPAVMKILTRVKGAEKIVLITDAIRATSMPEGTYDLGGQDVIVANGQARLKDGTLAGSILTMDKAVRNMISMVGVSFEEAIQMATINPAKCLGVQGRKGSLAAGKDADIVILDKKLKVRLTMVKGKIVYNREDK